MNKLVQLLPSLDELADGLADDLLEAGKMQKTIGMGKHFIALQQRSHQLPVLAT